MTGVLRKRDTGRQAQTRARRPRDDGDRDGSEASMRPAAPRTASQHQKRGERQGEDSPPETLAGVSGASALAGREQRPLLFSHVAGLYYGSHDLGYPAHPSRQEGSKTNPTLETKNRRWEDQRLFRDDTPRMSGGRHFNPGPPWFTSSGPCGLCKRTQSESYHPSDGRRTF